MGYLSGPRVASRETSASERLVLGPLNMALHYGPVYVREPRNCRAISYQRHLCVLKGSRSKQVIPHCAVYIDSITSLRDRKRQYVVYRSIIQ